MSGLPTITGDLEIAMAPGVFTGSDKRIRMDSVPSAHVAFAFETSGYGTEHAMPLMLMQALLGDSQGGAIEGKNRTSKLAIDMGEQGAAHDFSVFNVSYKDTGLFG